MNISMKKKLNRKSQLLSWFHYEEEVEKLQEAQALVDAAIICEKTGDKELSLSERKRLIRSVSEDPLLIGKFFIGSKSPHLH